NYHSSLPFDRRVWR
ncbi:unnamed protein product, partial [Callosobruchus maculatus]